MKKKKGTAVYISEEDFNRLTRKKMRYPSKDSPGDSASDELKETLLGKNFSKSVEREDAPVADRSSRRRASGDLSNREVSEKAKVISSDRPDPKDDANSPTSTH